MPDAASIQRSFPPGSRVRVRDEEWAVEKSLPLPMGGYAVHVQGLTELVRHHKAIFLTTLDDIEALRPEDTKLVGDDSPEYRQTRLYLEALLRRTPPTDTRLHVAQKAALDLMPFQLVPVRQALEALRPRILIADGVGLGKTIEVGMLLSELIKRGRGRRILVVVIKSMLGQFQRELWARFAIPLVRLDSEGIARVQARIPANRNPFTYYDRAIISVDTLKNNGRYRAWLEQTRWDAIVVDECHNVANRGSQREALARLLATTCESLVLTSATPHNGRPESFANLMRMLDPAAIADEKNFTREDIEHLFVRRFKKDVEREAASSFAAREVTTHVAQATPAERAALEALRNAEHHTLGRKRHDTDALFRWTLVKAFLSSPQAAIESIDNRRKRIKEALEDDQGPHPHAATLKKNAERLLQLRSLCEEAVENFSKLGELIRQLKALGFNGSSASPRVLIFSERIRTLELLKETLCQEFGIDPDGEVIGVFTSGELSDIDQRKLVEEFGRTESKMRLLLASDAASEGVNLHYHCNQLFHFDIPWSIIRLTQRMGRIDRFGQKKTPHLRYVLTRSQDASADQKVVDRLIQKEAQVHKQLGDAGSLLGLYDPEAEEEHVLRGLAHGREPNAILPDEPARPEPSASDEEVASPEADGVDLFALLDGDGTEPAASASDEETTETEEVDLLALLEDARVHAPKPGTVEEATEATASLFDNDDFSFAVTALRHVEKHPVAGEGEIQWDADEQSRSLRVHAPEPYRQFREPFIPDEAVPKPSEPYRLVASRSVITSKILEALEGEGAWPEWHLLWEQHPLMDWLLDAVVTAYARHEAPALVTPALGKGRAVFLFSAVVSNQSSRPVYTGWFGVPAKLPDLEKNAWPLHRVLEETALASATNPGNASRRLEALQELVAPAVKLAAGHVEVQRRPGLDEMRKRVRKETRRLEKWVHRSQEMLDQREKALRLKHGSVPTLSARKLRQQRDHIERFQKNHHDWLQSLQAHGDPYLRLVAVFSGE